MESLQTLHSAHAAVLSQQGEHAMPLSYGDFPGEVQAIESALGILDVQSSTVLGLRGAEAAAFLNGVTTNNVKALAVGRAQESLLCGGKGKILHPIVIVRMREEEFLVLSEPGDGPAVATHLDSYHIQEDLQMGQAPLLRLDVLGPGTGAALAALGLPLPALLHRFQEQPAVTVALPLGGLARVLVLVPATLAATLAQALLEQDAAARLVGWEAFEESRIWAGVPRFGVDYTAEHLPAEAALYTHIAFEKGCYVGQEVHARMHYRGHANRKLVVLDVPAPQTTGLAVGSAVYHGGAAVGQITSLARLARPAARAAAPLQRRALAMVRQATLTEVQALALSADGPPCAALSPVATDLGVARR